MAQSKLPSKELFEELYTKFILYAPQEDREAPERLMFLIEEAHWVYADYYCDLDPTLKNLTLRQFTELFVTSCPGMGMYRDQANDIYMHFQAYKRTVPCMGAIFLDPSMNYVLLVKGVKKGSSWGFPKGKIGKDETDEACCIREVFEETGYDVSSKIVHDEYIETFQDGTRTKLYIITDVALETPFSPQTLGEIGAYAWHEIDHLPTTPDSGSTLRYTTVDGAQHRFFMVWPFLKQLKTFIKRQQQEMQSEMAGAGKAKKRRRRKKKDVESETMQQISHTLDIQEERIPPVIAPIATSMESAWNNFKLDYDAVLRFLIPTEAV